MKSILIVGLGRFGKRLGERFTALGNQVMAVDTREDRVTEALEYATSAQIGDATNEKFIRSLGVADFDVCVVAIGDEFQASLETTALLKDHGAPLVVARASRDVHAKFLLRNGADYIIYPEEESAERAAVKFSSENIFDYIEMTPEYSIYEITVPQAWVGKSILERAVRTRHKISILATKQNGKISPLPSPEHVFTADETLIIMGHNDDVQKLVK